MQGKRCKGKKESENIKARAGRKDLDYTQETKRKDTHRSGKIELPDSTNTQASRSYYRAETGHNSTECNNPPPGP